MLKCAHCGRTLAESEALKHKTENGQEEIICRDCFKKITGIDYDTFSFRRENAKMTLFAVLFCVIATIYAFAERGPLWGLGGIALTVLVYLFSSKAR
jgi:DNA-directed RNA polymerase subunit RPC12/RpoP